MRRLIHLGGNGDNETGVSNKLELAYLVSLQIQIL